MSFHSVAKHALTYYYDGNAELVGKLLDGIAHELAEKIRAGAEDVIEAVEREFPYLDGDDAVKGLLGAADFIDPEVEK
ncbi:hypothetical protein [Streptomyces sp. NPDC056061]|uniref:hypothetical protein n=1 Tax=Streptomyces sp. NPDC056061 TaxID=3345700 RepID=UPI0035DC5EA6